MINGFDDIGVHLNAQRLGEILLQQDLSLATAESCTGGLLSGALTSVPGSSAWYEQGWVTYTNKSKVVQLGVCPETLKQFGAVGEQVARQMAAGALAMSPRASLALSTTGIAGPGGGSEDKPVGLVWFGFARRLDDKVIVTAAHQVFNGSRDDVRRAAVEFSIAQTIRAVTRT